MSPSRRSRGGRAAISGVTPITTGITNRNFLIEAGDEAFVLRLAGATRSCWASTGRPRARPGEPRPQRVSAPRSTPGSPSHGCLVTRFVPGAHIPGADLEREDVLTSVVGSVRAFHSCPPISSSSPCSGSWRATERIASDRGVTIPDAYDDAHAVAARIEEAFAGAPMPRATCHNDLLNANFLLDGDHVWIVDYEYAGMGDPFFDLGNLSVNNGLSPQAQETLLAAVLRAVGDVHRARLALMRVMSDFREAMWGVVQQGISTLDVDYVEYAATHFAGSCAMPPTTGSTGLARRARPSVTDARTFRSTRPSALGWTAA